MTKHKKNDCSTVISDRIDVKNRTILQGGVLEQLRLIPNNTIDIIISSPPYWGLRDYGIEGQWGLEPDFREYLKKMRDFMKELKRILKSTGTCWINLGDTYSGGNAHSDSNQSEHYVGKLCYSEKRMKKMRFKSIPKNHIVPKSRYGIPERFYIQSIDDGWIARNHIPWVKENPMPSSVKDRFTNKWESIFFFSKTQRYYFNLNAVREKPKTDPKKPKSKASEHGQLKLVEGDDILEIREKYEDVPHLTEARLHRDRPGNPNNKQDQTLGRDGKPKVNYKGFNDRWQERKWGPEMGTIASKHPECFDAEGNCLNNPNGKNPGDVFYINPKPFPEAHFATFPIDLPLKILKCSCPNQVCNQCGKPREPILKPTEEYEKFLGKGWHDHENDLDQGMQQEHYLPSVSASYKIVGYTDCGCEVGFRPGIVLDPFFGSGTVGCAAEELGLNWIGIELNSDYVKIASKRLEPYMMERLI